jgi:hypothetical protein
VQAQNIVIKNALAFYIDFVPALIWGSKAVKNLQDIPYVGSPPTSG